MAQPIKRVVIFAFSPKTIIETATARGISGYSESPGPHCLLYVLQNSKGKIPDQRQLRQGKEEKAVVGCPDRARTILQRWWLKGQRSQQPQNRGWQKYGDPLTRGLRP